MIVTVKSRHVRRDLRCLESFTGDNLSSLLLVRVKYLSLRSIRAAATLIPIPAAALNFRMISMMSEGGQETHNRSYGRDESGSSQPPRGQ